MSRKRTLWHLFDFSTTTHEGSDTEAPALTPFHWRLGTHERSNLSPPLRRLSMDHRLTRRTLLKTGAAAIAVPLLPLPTQAQERRFQPQVGPWRSFELTMTINVPEAKGTTRLWLPVPDVDTEYQKAADHSWTGNAVTARLVSDKARGVRMLYAEFPASESAPTLQLTSRVQTRSRAVDWSRPGSVNEDPALLKASVAPTELLPVDGLVHKTALEATRGASTDVDKARALYQWVVNNAHREPKTRGCGVGDIKAMLESGNLGGKCADLNAIFVGMCRSVGIPARDIYGLRLAPSAFGYRELGANSANLKGAQHCRAEAFLRGHGWVAMDPADALKVMRQEMPDWIKDPAHPIAAPVVKGLFGSWEGNWVAYNTAHDITLPGVSGKSTLPFLMYPQGENANGRFDELAPDNFRYTIAAREITA
jgi:transglutaminase-like putative cysteine protease